MYLIVYINNYIDLSLVLLVLVVVVVLLLLLLPLLRAWARTECPTVLETVFRHVASAACMVRTSTPFLTWGAVDLASSAGALAWPV